MASIKDVASAIGMSTATVSRALRNTGHVSPATRRKVAAAAEQLGYVASSSASGLASGRTRNVGIVVPFLNRWYFSAVIDGAQQELLRHGYDLTLYHLGPDPESRRSVFEQFLLRQRVDAVIAVALELADHEVQTLHALGKPLVGLGGPLEGVRTLAVDNEKITRIATGHLVALGHTRIAYLGGSPDDDGAFGLNLSRRLGFTHAMADAGLDVPAHLYRAADYTIDTGYSAARLLLTSAEALPTAIVAGSDEMAIGAVLAARDLDLAVPRDVSVTGVDDHELAAFFGLTTVAQDPRRQGRLAVQLLMVDLQPGALDDFPVEDELPVELVVRGTTARPRPTS